MPFPGHPVCAGVPPPRDWDPKGCSISKSWFRLWVWVPKGHPVSGTQVAPRDQNPKGCPVPGARTRIPKDAPSHALGLEMLLGSALAPCRSPRGSFAGCITQAKVAVSTLKCPKPCDIQCQSHAGIACHLSAFGTVQWVRAPAANSSQPEPWYPIWIQNRPREGD